ncbi:ankyrin repeat domain-containing protein [Burkholderia cenocepacia]|uniref:ankyrin repeat domain-containing protein n=1 Tax=Burkholderia cenocepacia TaxID=95486 RepID=UPI000981807A|nr:ankyrin repeat domain-containing protein [Burkholderia cenocepacia]
MNEKEIEQANVVIAELSHLSSTGKFTSITPKLYRKNYHLDDENITVSGFTIECEIQAYTDYESLEAGMSKAVFSDGREEKLYFFNPLASESDKNTYFESWGEVIDLLVNTSKKAWYRGELLAHLHFGNTAKLEYVKEIYETGFIDQQTTDKALELSVLSGRPFIEYILSKGADIQANDNEAIHEACRVGDLDIVRFLISHEADPLDKECILVAAREGHIDIVEYLLSLGANEAVARTYANADVDQYFQAKDFAQKLSSSLREKTASTDRTKI